MKQSQLNGDEIRVMVVDDDPDFGASLAQLIELQGYQCTLARSASKAKKTAKKFDPQVALIDLRLGKDNGMDLIGELKESEPDILCVLMTAYASMDVAISALHQEVFEFLTKPIDNSHLQTVLGRCFDRVSLRLAEKKAEEELQRSEERFRLLVEGSPQGILIHKNLKPLFVNQSAVATLGYESPEAFHREVKSIRKLMHPDDRDRLLDINRRRVRGKSVPNEYEAQFRHRDGSKIWVHLSSIMLEWQGERVNQTLFMDITERKRAEEAQRNSQRLLQTVFDVIPQWIFVKDKYSRYLMVNNAFAESYGLTPEDFKGKNTLEMPTGTKEELALFMDTDRQVLESGVGLDMMAYPATLPDGRRRISHSHKLPFRDDAGNIIGVVGVLEDVTQRVEAEEKLRENKNFQQSVFDAIPVPVWFKDLDGRYRMINKAWCDLLNLSRDEMLGKKVADLEILPGEIIARMEQKDRLALKTRQLVNLIDQRLELPNGDVLWQHIFRAPLIDRAGNVAGLVGVALDTTDQVQAGESLAASEEKYRQLIHGSLQGIMVHRDFKLLFANQAYADIFGFGSPEELVAVQDHRKFFAPNELARVQKFYYARIRDKKAPERYEFQGIRKDGATIWVETMVKKVMWDGEPAIQAFCIDVTERKRAEQELRSSQRLLRTVIDTIPHWVFAKDADNRYLLVNQTMATSLGVTPQSMTGQKTLNFRKKLGLRIGTDEELAALVEMDRHVMETGKSVEEEDFLFTEPGGKHRIHHIRKMPLHDESGAAVGVVGMSENITKRKEMERQLRQSQKMEAVGQLAGGVAHDFNNMLQIIISYVHLARASLESPDKLPKFLDNIGNSAYRATNLTRQLLTFSRKDVLQPRILDINELISNLMKMLGRLLGENIEMEILPGIELNPVNADPGMLEQVLVNLSVNARDAMPGGGKLTIETSAFQADEEYCRVHGWRRPGEYLLTSVSDTGEGMTAEVRERIFEPFYTTKEPGRGTGLGLSMVYSIIEQHQGSIAVHSEPGVGTSFRIYLPAIEGKTSTQEEQEVEDTPGGTETILIAEDEESVREPLCELLEAQGYRVLLARDGEQAVSLYSSHQGPIDLVIMDVVMPKLSGRKAFDQIRGIDSRVPIVFSTGYSAKSLDREFLDENDLTIIHKPYSPALLLQTVREAIDGTSESPRGSSRSP